MRIQFEMGGSSSTELRNEIDDLKTKQKIADLRYNQKIANYEAQLVQAKKLRDESLAKMKDLEKQLAEESAKSQAEIELLKKDQERMMAQIDQLLVKLATQERQFQERIDEARKENAALREEIEKLVTMLREERAEHAKEMAEMQARGEELINKVREEDRERAKKDREAMLEEIGRLMNKPTPAVGIVMVDTKSIVAENKRRADEVDRQICRIQRKLELSVKAEIMAITDMVKDHPAAGALLARLVEQSATRGEGLVMGSSCGGFHTNVMFNSMIGSSTPVSLIQ
jgi:DNA repair exonuclease SbcCD ATPase subunit